MAIYGATSILPGVLGSIKQINPADAIGNGTGISLTVGDFFIVFHNSSLYFYKVQSGLGQSENGSLLLISEIDPSIYFVRTGLSKDTVEGSFSGDSFYVTDGSDIPPVGFTTELVPYSLKNYTYLKKPVMTGDAQSDWSWCGTGIYNGYLYLKTNYGLLKTNIETGVSTWTDIDSDYSYWENPGHCLESDGDGSDKYLTDNEVSGTLSRFNMDTEMDDPIPYIMPSGESWVTMFGRTSPLNAACPRIGKWHYIFGDYGTYTIGSAKVNILTGEVIRLADSPSPGIEAGVTAPDFITGDIYHINRNNHNFYRWNKISDTWDTLASFSKPIWACEIAWKDDISNTIIVCTYPKQVGIYDIYLNAWEYFDSPEFDDTGVWSSYCYWYKDIGAFWPWGYTKNPGVRTFYHGIIPSVNPSIITKG